MRIQDGQLKRFVTDSGLVTRRDIEHAENVAAAEKRTLSEALTVNGALTEDDVRRIEAYALGIPYISLFNRPIDFEILSLIPEPIARKHNIIAFKQSGDTLEVALLDIDELPAIDFIKQQRGLKIMSRLTDTESIKHALRHYQRALKNEFGSALIKESSFLKDVPGDRGALTKIAEGMPASRMVDVLLRHAIAQGAVDIHIEPLHSELLVRYRTGNRLYDAMSLPRHVAPIVAARIKVLANLDINTTNIPQDGRFRFDMRAERYSVRVSILPVVHGEKIVMRLSPMGHSNFTLEGIGFHGDALENVYEGMKREGGLLCVAGPKGAGKTTTLYTLLDLLNAPETNIMTIEDGIEYQLPRVCQTQVKPEVGLTLASGLRSLLRQDPDVVMVSDISTDEMAELAVNAALSGRLILSALNASSSAAAIVQLREKGAEPFALSSVLRTVVGQRLVQRLADTKDSYTLTAEEKKELEKYVDLGKVLAALQAEGIIEQGATWNAVLLYRGDLGYKGHVGVQEVLFVSPAIKELIREGGSKEDIEKEARRAGMLTIAEDALFKAALGLTTVEEVLRIARESEGE